MKYAYLNNERIEPQKGTINARCPICGELVIPKCGDIKMHHWAHKTKQNCDIWWKNETEWHRKWKSYFPKEFQEIVMYDDKTGEKHIADVKTNTGIVIEFQHSSMKRNEQLSREHFYKNMVWMIDARGYYDKFKEHMTMLKKRELRSKYFTMIFDTAEPSKICFPKRWLESSVPVIFDFGVHYRSESGDDKQKKWLYCIFPERVDATYCGMYITNEEFIDRVSKYESFFSNLEFPILKQEKAERVRKQREEERRWKEKQRKQREAILHQQEKWREAIFKLQNDILQKKLTAAKLYVSSKGKLTDNLRTYNEDSCMVLGIKSSSAEYNGQEYMKNQVMLLIEHEGEVAFATTNLRKYIVDTKIYHYRNFGDLYCEDDRWNYRIRTMKVNISPFNKFQLSFEYSDTIWATAKVKESLRYIREKFPDCIQ